MGNRMRTRRRGGAKKSNNLSFKKLSKNKLFSISSLKSIIKLGVSGMTAMYLANWLMTIGAVGSTISQIASLTGLSIANISYAVKGTTIAAVAIRLDKYLE